MKREEEGVPVAGSCREAQDQLGDVFQLGKNHTSLMQSEMERFGELEQESARLKKIGADLSLDKELH
ncbi:hypothetical protein [Roseibium album]|uniref:hypothetical protein n=1 Tax=Roseibium album TaxID=311410 RepID=UPI002491E8BF|nr:hypothetical protein [Roseibium album]